MAKANAKEKSTSTAHHPPYFDMIADAVTTLKDRTGSSQQAIAKFIEDKHKKLLPPNFRTLLSVQLKKFVKSERLFKVKNSFKISSTEKLKLEIHENQKDVTARSTEKSAAPLQKAAKGIAEKGLKTKRLSHVKTPDDLKKANRNAQKKPVASPAGKVKRLSQVKTPETMKKKTNVTPKKRQTASKPINSDIPAKKAKR